MRSYLNLSTVTEKIVARLVCILYENILNTLSLKFKTAPTKEKLVSIIMDEMSLKHDNQVSVQKSYVTMETSTY